MSAKRFGKLLSVTVFLALSLVGGCSKKITVYRIPAFWTEDLKSLVVVPFRNQTNMRGAGEVISDQLTGALMHNGTYKVYNRNDLKVLLDQADLSSMLTGEDANVLAKRFSKLGKVQMILVGEVNTYSATSTPYRRQKPVSRYDRRTKRYYTTYVWEVGRRNEANVSVTARLIRTDGTTIYSTPAPAHGSWAIEGSPPALDPYGCRAVAVRSAVGQLLAQLAITRKVIKLDPGKALRTARRYYEGEWEHAKEFKSTDEKMFVVLALPPDADRNTFKITIIRKDTEEYLVTRKVAWSRSWRTRGLEVSPKDLAARGGGPGTYTVKFYSGAKPVFTSDFRIIP